MKTRLVSLNNQTFASPTFTGVATFADGSATNPSIAFTGQPTTGIYYATSAVRISINGSQCHAFSSAAWFNFSNSASIQLGASSDFVMGRMAAGSGGVTTGRWSVKQGAAVASAGEVTLGSDGNRFQITGTTQIDKILSTGWQGGSIITLMFQGSVTVTHNTANNGAFHGFRLAGAANFSATANDQLTLQYDSTTSAWFEIARVVI